MSQNQKKINSILRFFEGLVLGLIVGGVAGTALALALVFILIVIAGQVLQMDWDSQGLGAYVTAYTGVLFLGLASALIGGVSGAMRAFQNQRKSNIQE